MNQIKNIEKMFQEMGFKLKDLPREINCDEFIYRQTKRSKEYSFMRNQPNTKIIEEKNDAGLAPNIK